MPNPLETVLHHSEPIDPTLWEWLSLKIDDVLGLHSSAMVFILGSVTVLFPVVVMLLVWRRHRITRGD
ncbi:MAG: hypothetical protein QF595_09750 [Dehalococcoidia bacterium]|nr:hypothetical protein [Dehalococcoidia bacterium]